VLVNQQDCDVLPLACELIKGGFDGAVLCLRIHDEEVLLCVRGLCYVLLLSIICLPPFQRQVVGTHADARKQHARYCVLSLVSQGIGRRGRWECLYHLIANHSKKLPVLVC
jgi:hypothetical protein